MWKKREMTWRRTCDLSGVEVERNATPLMGTSASQEEVRSVQGQALRASEEGSSEGEEGPEKAQELSNAQINSEE